MLMQTSAPCAPPEQTRPRATVAPFLPRFIRLRDAPSYLGMDKNRFNREVRPLLSAIPIGTQGVAFDRLDLDTWADDYKSRNGHPAAQPERGNLLKCAQTDYSRYALTPSGSPCGRSTSPDGEVVEPACRLSGVRN